MQSYQRIARYVDLQPFDTFAKPHHFMEVVEWFNGEGFDIHLSSCMGEQHFSLTWGELRALHALVPLEDEDFED